MVTPSQGPKRELLSLIGKLSFTARAIPAGRLFLRRLISLSTTVPQLHHHLRLTSAARADIEWWCGFLPTWNGTAKFVDPVATPAPDFELFTDAAGTLGCGAFFQGAWFHYSWQDHQLNHSIQWKELFAMLAAAMTWGHLWTGRRLKFLCDNQAIVQAWEGQRSRNSDLMILLRRLYVFFAAARGNFPVMLQHLPGVTNQLADAISRKQFDRFFCLAPQANPTPTRTPGALTTV